MQTNSSSMEKSHLAYSELNLTSAICLNFPSQIMSGGLWVQFDDHKWWLKASLPLLEFQLILFCFSLAITHLLLKHFGVSKVSSQILIGLIFGCSWKQFDKEKINLFYVPHQEVLGLLADFGYALYLFLSAVKIDASMTIRAGKKALAIGISAFIVPLITGNFVQSLLDYGISEIDLTVLPIMITIYSMSSFPVIACLLSDLQIVNSELGRLGLSSALVSDLLSLFMMVTAKQAKLFNDDPATGSVELVVLISLLLLILFVFRPLMLWIIRQTPEGMPVKGSYIQVVIFSALFSLVLSNFTGQASLMGPYILGLAVPDGAPLASTLVDKIECLVSDVFMPILVTTCALRADLSQIPASFAAPFTKLNMVLILATFVVKIVSCFLSSRYFRLPFEDSLALSLIMSSKGAVELVLYTLARDYNGIDDGLLGCCVIFIFFVATVVPITVKCLYDPSRKYAGYQNRTIMHLNPSSDQLRLLACIHRDENINGIIHLLNLSCPTAKNPLTIHIFHLIELSGRTAPIFISHKYFQNKSPNDRSYSQHIIHSFNQFERCNDGTVDVECFSAISPNRFMHDDVCTLALDKVTSLIILPFHRTWTVDGFVYHDDNMIRTLNNSVLERAPCSIGIFADRGRLGSIAATAKLRLGSKYSVCMIFLGGKDDREAISYAKRMTKDSRVELTVLRLLAPLEEPRPKTNNWEEILDAEALRDFRSKCSGDGRVVYEEDVCKDGQQTAFILRKLVDKYDIMIVGRRNGLESPQTDGLNEWNEFPELGVLGDLIASTDINSSASLLVIQQQQIIVQ